MGATGISILFQLEKFAHRVGAFVDQRSRDPALKTIKVAMIVAQISDVLPVEVAGLDR